jgi:hypothetical protein
MHFVWFIVSVIANLISPAPAIGGAFTGALWAVRRPNAAFVVLGTTIAAIGYLSFRHYSTADIAYSMTSQFCAMVPWTVFAHLLVTFLPEALPPSTRGGPSRWLARIRA